MERKTLYAILLSIAVVILWDVWYYYRYKDVLEANRSKMAHKRVEQQTNGNNRQPLKENAPASPASAPAPTPALAVESKPLDLATTAPPAQGRTITVDTGVSNVSISTTGGIVESIKLFRYKDADGGPIEIVDAKSQFRPLSLEFATPEASNKINSAVFSSAAPDKITLTAGNKDVSVPLTMALPNGVVITKTLVFHHLSYLVDLQIGVSGPGVEGTTFGVSWNGIAGEEGKSYSYVGPVVLVDDKRLADSPKEKEPQTHEGNVLWGGVTNKYYCAAFLPTAVKSKFTARKTGEKDVVTLQLPAGSANGLAFYAGPKDHGELNKTGRELIRMINYGWFDILANPLFILLTWFNSIIGNFGFSIILLTVLVKLLFWPLSQASFKSVEKMKKVQPEMKMLQERYKNDRTKMNEELIALYKKYNINPMAGCLPIILQIPVFVALYKVLLESIDLKGANFVLWIHDLSTKDPYYVTPVLMGLSMLAQQKMSPSSTDPLQRKLMLAMPLVFTVMFINFPSGLVIYWLVNNLLSILQQYLLIMQQKEA
ncbi:MAG: membrane protein insertase YidC [Nitrospinae bacterium]|nr:membrane protein insertase YidC [Nitrospinota bacterium]